MQSIATTPAPNTAAVKQYEWPPDLAGVTYEDMKWLARRFAPSIVMFPRHGSKSGEREDYHPMDVRQLFNYVSANLAYENKLPIARFLATVGRTWPAVLFAASGVVFTIFVWLLFSLPDVFADTNDFSERIWLLFLAVIIGFVIFSCLWVAGLVVLRIPWPWMPGMAAAIAMGVWFLATVTGLWPNLDHLKELGSAREIYGPISIIGVLINVLLRQAFVAVNKADPKKLLEGLDADKGSKLDGSLQFIDAGSLHDREKHKKRYVEIVSAPGTVYRETAYVHVSPGQYRFKGLLAIQYWFFYYYNDWENVHESDWEQVTVYVDPGRIDATLADSTAKFKDARPLACAFSAHDGGHIALWVQEDMEWIVDDEGGQHPVVYVAWGSHANYPKAGQYPATTNFAGLTIGGREAGLFKGSTLYGYVDVTYPAGPANVYNEAAPVRWNDDAEIALVVIPPGLQKDGKTSWPHICETSLSPAPCNAGVGPCERDFNWLNLKDGWGAAGSLFGGDGAPDTPCNQGSWRPFEWLARCRQVHVGDGHEIFAGYLDRLRREAAIRDHVANRPPKPPVTPGNDNGGEVPYA